MVNPKISYDKTSKILSIRFKNVKSVDSDMKKNVVFDYDKSGEIVNIDVMDFNLEERAKKKSAKKV